MPGENPLYSHLTVDLHPLERLLQQRIVILDGAMGTMIQRLKLGEADYRGDRFRDWKGGDLKGSLELLQLTRAGAIEQIHTDYLEAGADISKPTPSAARPSACTTFSFRTNRTGRARTRNSSTAWLTIPSC